MKEFAYIHEEGQLPEPLNAVPFLNSFSDEQLDEVLNSSSLLQCDPGDVIIKEGSIDSRIYILLGGALEVCVGGKSVASIVRVGDVFGELALVNHDRRAASVIASTRSLCMAVDQKFLQDLHPREEDPAFHAALFEFVARLVAKKLDATSRRLAEVERELRQLREQNDAAQATPPPVKKPALVRKRANGAATTPPARKLPRRKAAARR